MKKKLLLSILALLPAAFLPLAATCQVVPDREPAEQSEPTPKYEIYAGFSYTGLNQVNGSRYGLMGANASVTRNWGKYWGVTADGAYFKYPLKTGNSGGAGNPGKPSVDSFLMGPVLHFDLFGRYSALAHVLLGVEHTGGENMTPNISFAWGAGGGLEYRLTKRLFLRATGDDISASFSVINNSPTLGYSPHWTRSPRASFGAVYKF